MAAASRVPLALNLGAKLLLVALLAYAQTHLELDRLAGKAMTARAVAFPVFTIVIPVVWALRGRRRPYPHVADALLVSPFIVDIAGNVLGLYNSISWFDDAAHAVTWGLLTLAVGLLIVRLGLDFRVSAALAIGFGAVSNVVWEILEFVAMRVGSPGLQLTYVDTIGDLGLSLCGTLLAGLITGWTAARRSG